MALKGNLRDFSIIQILNIINIAKKSGTLYIKGSGEVSLLAFRAGKLSYAQIGSEDSSLPAILYRQRKINHNQYKLLKERSKGMSDKQLGLMLINAGYVGQDEILESIQLYYIGAVRRFFTWVEGVFQFEQDKPPPADCIPVKVDLENVIIEGSRQLREWEQLKEEIPSLDMAVRFIERPGADLRNLNLNVEEWRVVKFVNPKNTIRQIAEATKMNELEIRRVVYGLLQAGVVELVRLGGLQYSFASALPDQNKEEQKSLVNRLIGRIRTI
jgi:hypothetical protein